MRNSELGGTGSDVVWRGPGCPSGEKKRRRLRGFERIYADGELGGVWGYKNTGRKAETGKLRTKLAG